jgi:hypothetical protein
MACNKIRVKVGEKDVANFEAECFRICDVLVDVALRIDNYRRTALLVAEQVRGVRQATEIILLQDHMRFESSIAG